MGKGKNEMLLEGILLLNGKNGFVRTEEENPLFKEIYIPPENLRNAFEGDKVVVSVKLPVISGRKPEGKIEKVTEEASRLFGGIIKNTGGKFVFVPFGKKRCPFTKAEIRGGIKDAGDGYAVTFELTEFNIKREYFVGRIEKVIGESTEYGRDITTILESCGITSPFPQDVIDELESIPDRISPQSLQAKLRKGRKDFRTLYTITVDSEDTKDVDDAVSVEKNQDGTYTLGVHIADVGEYVKEGSAIDKEAYRRGTSVYPVDRVVPMLPPKLSNGICSLNVGENRLALSVLLNIDSRGNVIKSSFFESVIKVHNKISYRQIYKMIGEKDPEMLERFAKEKSLVEDMYELSLILRKKRIKDGALMFELPETAVFLDEKGHPTHICEYKTTFANEIIEEFMVAANVAVAEHFCKANVPFMYRVHEAPEPEKIRKLAQTIKFHSGKAPAVKDKIKPADVAAMLESVKGKPCEEAVSFLALRSMQKAVYSEKCLGHFGIAAEYYCHFTSPIRRYPDLFIHRIIKTVLHGGPDNREKARLQKLAPEAADHCSETERAAQDAEMSVRDYKIIEYMTDHVGETYKGIISSITSFGFFVRLDNTAEGLVHYDTLSDYIEFDEISMSARGKRTGKIFTLGMEIEVTVERAEPALRQLDFSIGLSKGTPVKHIREFQSPKPTKSKGRGVKQKKDIRTFQRTSFAKKHRAGGKGRKH